MDTVAEALLAFAGLLLLGAAIGRVHLVLTFHRMRMAPPEGEPMADDESPLGALTDCEAAGVAELEALGFAKTSEWMVCQGAEPMRAVFMANVASRAVALLMLSGNALHGYPVSFHSFDRDGRSIETLNRLAWLMVGCRDSPDAVDARADSLAGQWAAHCLRIANAREIDPAEALRWMRRQIVKDVEESLSSGKWVRGRQGAHLSLASALRVTMALRRERSMLAVAYRSPMTSGELVPEFMGDLLAAHERALARRPERVDALKSIVLLLSLLVALWLWGLAFDWRTAVLLVGVLLLHESGHALAMRLFGWGDLHMFFVPFIGAFTAGRRPRELPAWKEAIVLFAGPLPGLLAGLALLSWPSPLPPLLHSAAVMAVVVNAINLLPLMPLDGGRLVEIALFSRWPRGRVALLAASVAGLFAGAFVLKEPLAGALGVLLLLSLRQQRRLASLEQAVIDDATVPDEALERRVARVIHERTPAPKANLPLKMSLAVAVLARRRLRAARRGEAFAIVLLLAGSWVLAAPPLFRLMTATGRVSHAARPLRSDAQKAFDRAWSVAHGEPTSAQWAELLSREAALQPHDARHRDVEWLRTQTGSVADRMAGVDRWLNTVGDGYFERREGVVRAELDDRVGSAERLPAAERMVPLSAAIGWADQVAPRRPARTIDARLRLAEATDLAGDTPGANRLLDDISALAATVTERSAAKTHVVRARAWFEIAHGRPDVALQRLEAASPALVKGAPDDSLAIDHAWARLFAGQSEGAFVDMRAAFHADPRPPGAPPADDDFDADDAMDLAVAAARAGRIEAARALAQGSGRAGCEADAQRQIGDAVSEGPWQAARMRERARLARAWCGRPDAASTPASGAVR